MAQAWSWEERAEYEGRKAAHTRMEMGRLLGRGNVTKGLIRLSCIEAQAKSLRLASTSKMEQPRPRQQAPPQRRPAKASFSEAPKSAKAGHEPAKAQQRQQQQPAAAAAQQQSPPPRAAAEKRLRAEAAPFVPPKPAVLADGAAATVQRRSKPAPEQRAAEAAPTAPSAEEGAGPWTLVVKRGRGKSRSPSPRSSAADGRKPSGGTAGAIVPAGGATSSPAKKGRAWYAAGGAKASPANKRRPWYAMAYAL